MNSKLVVNGYELELSENIAVPLNLSITDIKEPEKRKRSFSKTITLEGTSNNMNFFIGAYALDISVKDSSNIQFTPNLRYDCKFYKNDLLIFRGKFKLNDVKIVDGGYTFDCNLISEAVDIFAKLKDKKLNELNWSEYDHELSRINVTRSWSTGVYLNGSLTRNFGADSLGYQPKSFGYIYPLVDYGYNKPANNSSGSFRTNQLYPFIYVKEAVKKCLDYALQGTNIEVDYTTTFFDNANMQKLIYGFGGGEQIKINSTQLNKLKIDLDGMLTPSPRTLTGTAIYKTSLGVNYFQYYEFRQENDIFKTIAYSSTPVFDINGVNNSTGEMIINQTGKYTLTVSGDFTINFTGQSIYYDLITHELRIEVDGVKYLASEFRQTNGTTVNRSITSVIDLKAGQKVKVWLQITERLNASNNNSLTYSFENVMVNLDADKDAIVTDGSIISLSSTIPDIKCSDFLKGIMNLFYAYMSDPIYNPTTNKSTIYIDSFVNFYENQSNYDNWTSLVDNSKDITIQSNSLVEGNIYAYKFSEEKDKFNNEYKLITGSNYGEKQINIDTWLNGEVKFELPFSTYPPVKPEGKNFIYPIVINEESKPYKGKGMLCFYNGLRQADVNIYNCANDTNLLKTFYPFTHHIRFQDNQNNIPLFDLHFSPRQFAFDSIYVVPNLNTFEVYHKKFLNEITSIDSKLVTLCLKLSYKDINELDFAKLKMIDGVLYRLNTIKDFDSDAYGTTEVELIKFLG
ncbi:hypothetical protein UFOVP603_8 [uncultured Caudovirales phage]|uniref:Uncharacterized protein n=1 Tax=uncultured Caudovirales phage TaxID=2100421 RepID=A0A6J5N101_9CAUD|nr:hypothetical protein UFOVP603_8 [uncultured Caudovirales phage]